MQTCRPRHLAAVAALALLGACQGCAPAVSVLADAGRLLGIVATCAEVQGDVQVRRAGEAYWEVAQVGTTLRGGDWVRTAVRSRCRIALVQGASVTIDEGTVAEIGQLGRGGEARALLALESGSVQARPGGGQEAGSVPLAFRTPDGRLVEVAARASGTEPAVIDVTVTAGVLHVLARRGSALVSVAGGPQQEAPQGSAIELAPGGTIISVLPPFPESRRPEVDAHLPCAPDHSIALEWAPVEAARAYRVQIAKDVSFQQLLVNQVVAAPPFGLQVPAGAETLAWRIASVDAKGRSGDFGFTRRIFCESGALQDQLLGPDQGAVFVTERKAAVRLSWRPFEPEANYRVVIARAADLSRQKVRAETTTSCELEVSLEPGTYYWGVYLLTEGLAPLFTTPRQLKVVAGAPRLKVPDAIRTWGE